MGGSPLYFEDLAIGQSDRFGAYAVTREEVIEIATRFDPQGFHIDDAIAAANPVFGRISASALHTMAMTGRMQADRAKVTGFTPYAGMGLTDMRAIRPVFPGDTLSVYTEITHLRPSQSRSDCGIVTLLVRTLNQHDEVVMQFTSVMLFKQRAAPPADA